MNFTSLLLTALLLSTLSFFFFQKENPHLQEREVQTKDSEFQFIRIPAGEFTFGYTDEIQRIDYDYYIMKYEVTTAQYVAFLNEALQEEKIWIKDDFVFTHYPGDTLKPKGEYYLMELSDRVFYREDHFELDAFYANHPIIGVGWFGCYAFCEHKGFRLPTAKEWEKAARGKKGWDYPWGNNIDGSRANYYGSGGPFEGDTNPVGFYNGNTYDGFKTQDSPSPYGLYDMSGNAWEYTADLWSDKVPFHVGAGGGFIYHTAAMVNTWYKSCFGLPYPLNLDRCDKTDGFRAVKNIKK